jgi:hypothetical protein
MVGRRDADAGGRPSAVVGDRGPDVLEAAQLRCYRCPRQTQIPGERAGPDGPVRPGERGVQSCDGSLGQWGCSLHPGHTFPVSALLIAARLNG